MKKAKPEAQVVRTCGPFGVGITGPGHGQPGEHGYSYGSRLHHVFLPETAPLLGKFRLADLLESLARAFRGTEEEREIVSAEIFVLVRLGETPAERTAVIEQGLRDHNARAELKRRPKRSK